jgi:hypothetical protein
LERVGEILKSILDQRTAESGEIWHRFFLSWESLVGPDLAGLTRLVEVERGEAIVQVEHPAASQLLGLHKETLLARIRREHPQVLVRALRVQVRPQGRAPAGPAARSG